MKHSLTPTPPADHRRRGFTLMEIMIVVVMFGILLAIAVPALTKARTSSHQKEARSELEIIAAAVRNLLWDTGKWPNKAALKTPGSTEIWDLTSVDAGLLNPSTGFVNWKGPYIRTIEKDPWGQPYFFDPDYYVGSLKRPAVGSFGPNRSGRNIYDADNIIIFLD